MNLKPFGTGRSYLNSKQNALGKAIAPLVPHDRLQQAFTE
jgi:hypothetical protein